MEAFWAIAVWCVVPTLLVAFAAVRIGIWLWRNDVNPVVKSFVGCMLLAMLAGAGCTGLPIGVGTRPAAADIALCKTLLTPTEGATLDILWQEYDEVVTDGLHNKDTCPILTLYPLQKGHTDGSISDADFAKRLYKFYLAKYDQDLAGKAKKVDAKLAAAGLPPLGGGGGDTLIKNPCPTVVDGKACGKASKKQSADEQFKYMKCEAGHDWKKPK